MGFLQFSSKKRVRLRVYNFSQSYDFLEELLIVLHEFLVDLVHLDPSRAAFDDTPRTALQLVDS